MADRLQHIKHLLHEVGALRRKVHQSVQPELCLLNLTLPKVFVLKAISSAGTIRPGDLAGDLELSASTVSGFLDTMEAQGDLRRLHSEEDRRQVRVSLTPQGEDKLANVGKTVFGQLEQRFAALSDAEMDTLIRLLNRLIEGGDEE